MTTPGSGSSSTPTSRVCAWKARPSRLFAATSPTRRATSSLAKTTERRHSHRDRRSRLGARPRRGVRDDGEKSSRQLTLTLPPEPGDRRASFRTPYGGSLLPPGYDIHTSRKPGAILLQLRWGRWRAAPDGVWSTAATLGRIARPSRQPSSNSSLLSAPHPALRATFPATRRRRRAEIDLCESHSPGGEGRPLPLWGKGAA